MSTASEPDPHSGSPVGDKADATPARRPGPEMSRRVRQQPGPQAMYERRPRVRAVDTAHRRTRLPSSKSVLDRRRADTTRIRRSIPTGSNRREAYGELGKVHRARQQ